MEKSIHDERGHELLDSTPMAIPVGFKRPETAEQLIKRLIRGAMSNHAQEQGNESWEEADDFDVNDDPELKSKYELDDEQDRANVREFIEETPATKEEKEPQKKGRKATPHTPNRRKSDKVSPAQAEPLEDAGEQ